MIQEKLSFALDQEKYFHVAILYTNIKNYRQNSKYIRCIFSLVVKF